MNPFEKQRLHANIAAIQALIGLAEELRREDLSDLRFDRSDWQSAIRTVANAPEPQPGDTAAVAEAIRLARKAVRRLADSGNARFGSFSVGRKPSSSADGQRFGSDLKSTQYRLQQLQEVKSEKA